MLWIGICMQNEVQVYPVRDADRYNLPRIRSKVNQERSAITYL